MGLAAQRTTLALLVLLGSCGPARGQAPPLPSAAAPVPPIYEIAPYTRQLRRADNATLYSVAVPGATPFRLIHLHGDTAARGRAYGQVMAEEILSMVGAGGALDQFYKGEIDSIPWAKLNLPDWLVKLLSTALKDAAPATFKAALRWVFEQQKRHLAASKSQPLVEMRAMAEGACGELRAKGQDCDVDELEKTLQEVNELPELIRMSCSMLGAHGPATPSGNLVQLRTLDFGGGPFVNHSVLAVHHPPDSFAFAQVSFTGFVGAVTGFSERVGLSEKVWETYDDPSIQPGTYQGLPVVGVIRNILQFATDARSAASIALSAPRTWAVFLGVGDTTQQFEALAYREKDLGTYDAKNISNVTGMAYIPGVAYIDKHPQPSRDTLDVMQKTIQHFALDGRMNARAVAQNLPRITASGDVHVTVYDFNPSAMSTYFALGAVNATGSYGESTATYPGGRGKACFQPIVHIPQQPLWDAK